MKKFEKEVLLFMVIACFYSAILNASTTLWPVPDWRVAPHENQRLNSIECEEFKKFSTNSKKFLTEGLVVVKDGQIQYEFYDSKYSATTPHVLWSVSKTITGALLGTAVRDGRLSLDSGLDEFYPDPLNRKIYSQIKMKNLFYFDAGFVWNEYYSGDVKQSPVINMLYGTGYKDTAHYSASKDIIAEGPGFKFNYSTGTPVLTMAVLQKVYGEDYETMPWRNLFNPLGMKNVIFERDHLGIFYGGSSVYATPRDMAKIGYLYLKNGMWNGKEILSQDWINKTKQVSPGYLSNGTVINDITFDGVYGGSIWLNKAVKAGFGKPYPASPDDMIYARGHYGQLIIILPSQNMVITRTGYDKEYTSKVDEFVSRAISCFHDPKYPIGKEIPAPKSNKIGLANLIKTLKTSLQENIIQAAVAKTICSCHYISHIDLKTCIDRSNIPLARQLTKLDVNEDLSDSGKYLLSARPTWLARNVGLHNSETAEVEFDTNHPEFGCTLK